MNAVELGANPVIGDYCIIGATSGREDLVDTVTVIGELEVFHQGSTSYCGLNGIVLSPDFKETKWIYIFYPPLGNLPEVYRISRFTLTNNQLNMKRV